MFSGRPAATLAVRISPLVSSATVTTHSAEYWPSFVVAVILVVPWLRPVTTQSLPLPVTEAISPRSLLHSIAWPTASPKPGLVTARVSVLPTVTLRVGLFMVMPEITRSKASVKTFVPLVTVTVMVVLPGWVPRFTSPVTGMAASASTGVTVATASLELFHSTLSTVAPSGFSNAVYCQVLFRSLAFFWSSSMVKPRLVASTRAFCTVTTHLASLPLPSFALAVMVAVPSRTALTVAVLLSPPLPVTAATVGSLLSHASSLLLAFAGSTVAVKVPLSPALRVRAV